MTDERTQEERIEAVRQAHGVLISALLNYQVALSEVGESPPPEGVSVEEAVRKTRIQFRVMADSLLVINVHKALWSTYLLTGKDPVIPDQDPPPRLVK